MIVSYIRSQQQQQQKEPIHNNKKREAWSFWRHPLHAIFGLLPLLPSEDDYLEAMEKFPANVMLLDQDGRLVLHVALERAAAARTKGRSSSSTITITPKVIQTLLQRITTKKMQDVCGVFVKDPFTGFYPFQMAGMMVDDDADDAAAWTTISYQLLRMDPTKYMSRSSSTLTTTTIERSSSSTSDDGGRRSKKSNKRKKLNKAKQESAHQENSSAATVLIRKRQPSSRRRRRDGKRKKRARTTTGYRSVLEMIGDGNIK